jgi:transcriptional regulator with XRE-family HTH domain
MELRIKEVCKTNNVSLVELAKRLNISRQSLESRIKNNPSIEKLQEIADALGVTVFELIKEDTTTYHSYNSQGDWMGVLKKPS